MSTAIPSSSVPFTTGEVAAATRGTLVRGDAARSHAGATTDSRAVGKGSIFVALRGENFDGHAFVDGAVKGGSSLVVVERNRGEAVGKDADVIEVTDTLAAWGDLAHAHFLRWKSHGGRIV
ncbi:MAG: Mur ligase domain-containing protein, partial [Polyangiaceae bacterium]